MGWEGFLLEIWVGRDFGGVGLGGIFSFG